MPRRPTIFFGPWATGRTLQLPPGFLDGFFQPFPAHRFEQVIDRADFERLQRVALIGGDENNQGRARAAQGAHHRQSVQLRHLLVEKHHVRLQIQDSLQCFFPGGRLAGDFQGWDRFDMFAQDLARHRFVVGDQDLHRHASQAAWRGHGWNPDRHLREGAAGFNREARVASVAQL